MCALWQVLDGSLTTFVDEWLYRQEQCETIIASAAPSAAQVVAAGRISALMPPEAAAAAAAKLSAAKTAAVCALRTPATLRSTLLRAFSILRWANVYTYYSLALDALPSRTRFALNKMATCADELFAACNYAAGPNAEPDWLNLGSEEAAERHEWLVASILYLRSHLSAGPSEVARHIAPQCSR